MTKRPVLPEREDQKGSSAQNPLSPVKQIPVANWAPYPPEDDSIDLAELLGTLWRYKWLILILPLLTVTGAYFYAQFLPKEYEARVTFLQISGNGGSESTEQIGALASIAGISLPKQKSNALTGKIEVVLKSRGFAEKLVKDMNLLPLIYAEVYDPKTNTYQLDKDPTPLDGAEAVMGALTYDETSEGAKYIEVTWNDPEVAAELANYSLKALENYLSENTLTASQKNLQFIEVQLEKAEKELRVGEEALRKFNRSEQYFRNSTEAEVLAKSISELHAMRAKGEVDREVMLQFRNSNSPQVMHIELGNEALDKQINKLNTALHKKSDKFGNLSFEKDFLAKELTVYQEIYKQMRIQLERGKLEAAKDQALFRVIDPALVPGSPSKPRKRLIITLSAMVALFFGIFLAFLIEFIRKLLKRVD